MRYWRESENADKMITLVVSKSINYKKIFVGVVGFSFLMLLLFILQISDNRLPGIDIDWENPPCSPEDLSQDWQEVTPQLMRQNSQRREFLHHLTGLKIAFDKGIAGKPKFGGKNHWHIYNPNSTSVRDYYLDKNGNPLHKNNPNSHFEGNCK